MIISAYTQKVTKDINYRITLNSEDKTFLRSKDNYMYQLKCIGATGKIFEYSNTLNTKNLSFSDRIFPRLHTKAGKILKATFEILFSVEMTKKFLLNLKIDFYENDKIVIRDSSMRSIDISRKFLYPNMEYKIQYELEILINKALELPKKAMLCNNCPHFLKYKELGYCLNYHPDSRL